MARLEERVSSSEDDNSVIGRVLPEDVRQQLVHAKKVRSHSVSEMIEWLHDPEEGHPPEWRQITKTMLSGWFWRNGVTGPAKKGGAMPRKRQANG